MKLAGCCGAQSPESRFTPANTRAAANHGFFRKEDLLAAPGRSRHFGPSESAVRLDSGAGILHGDGNWVSRVQLDDPIESIGKCTGARARKRYR